jgi:transcriptional regulator with GAF, ATPase, and Fis domain
MRISPRIEADLLVTINEKDVESKATIRDIGMEGVFIRGRVPSPKVGETLFMKYDLPGYIPLEQSGKMIRKEPSGIAIAFYNIDASTKIKLWKFILDNLGILNVCPYCGEHYDEVLPPICKRCNWRLDFHLPDYFEYYEKNHLLKKLYSKADHLEADQIGRLINFVDVDLLKGRGSGGFQEFVGTSDVMREVFSKIRRVAPTDIPVLILGESGTGKELTALAIHERSPRKDKVFVPINCAAIPETLLESELFGYEKGAFTGAYHSKVGKCEHADGGTLFLDEVAELSPGLQAKLLRFLENQIVERIGAGSGKKVNVRVIAATNCKLDSAIAEGKFRKDLYYRLDAFTINLPSVRERNEDKIVLARYFLKKFSREMGASKEFTEDVAKAIMNYDWPGNVREIINKVRKAIVMSNGSLLTPQDLDLDSSDASVERELSLQDVKQKIEKQKVKEVIEISGNNMTKAAKMLGISRPSLYILKKKYNL